MSPDQRNRDGISIQAVGVVVQRHPRRGNLDPFYVEFIRGMESVLLDSGFNLMLQICRSSEEEIARYHHWARTGAVRAVLVVDLQTDDPRPGIVRGLGLPAVILGNPGLGKGLPAVWTNDGAAMRDAVTYLSVLGHRHIAHVGGPVQLFHTQERDAAFFATAKEYGMSAEAAHADYTEAGGARETATLFAQPFGLRPTAIIYDNDLMALGGRSHLLQAGCSIPGDISLLAWDDSLGCQLAGLSALSRDLAAYGALAARTLLDRIQGSSTGRHLAEIPHLVVRESTGPCNPRL